MSTINGFCWKIFIKIGVLPQKIVKKKPENSIDGGNLKGIYAPYLKCCVNFDKVLHSSRVKAKIIM